MSNQQHKKLLKARKALEPILVRHNLTPIVEMNFRDYHILDRKPPEGNLRMTRMFFMELERRGRQAAQRSSSELGGLYIYFKREISAVGTADGRWGEIKAEASYRLDVDYWDADSVPLHVPRSPLAGTLYQEYNDKFVKALGLSPHFELTDFLVFQESPVDDRCDLQPWWQPLNTFSGTISADELANVKNWS